MNDLKQCNKCQKIKHLDEFEQRTDCSTKYGACRSCRRKSRAGSLSQDERSRLDSLKNKEAGLLWDSKQ